MNRRSAATLLSAAACTAAVVSFVAADGRWGFRAGRDVLLSAAQQSEFKDATALKRIHSSYDRAKGRLARMSTAYTDLGVKLQAAETRAGSLRTELESKMREIRGEFHRGEGVGLAKEHRSNTNGVLMSLAEEEHPRKERTTNLEREVAELRDTVTSMDAKEAMQATELQQLRHEVPDVAEGDAADVMQFPRRPMVAFRADTLRREKLASLSQLHDVNLQLKAENRHICELCAQSAVLRGNRQKTCSICSQYSPGLEDTVPLVQPHISTSLAGDAISVFVSDWKTPSTVQVQKQQQLVQIDDSSHMGTPELLRPTVTAFVISSGQRYVVGTCAPSLNDLKFSSWHSICTMCKGQLGVDVHALGHAAVQCSH